MKVLTAALPVIATLALALPAAAGVETLHDPKADFGSYATYEWMESKAIAEIPEIRDYMIKSIQAQLQSAGLKRVKTGGDLRVGLRLVTKDDPKRSSQYDAAPNWNFVYGWSETRVITEDTLIVDMVDAAADHGIWQGFATEKINDQDRTNYGRLRKKIDKIVSKMFSEFPPQPDK